MPRVLRPSDAREPGGSPGWVLALAIALAGIGAASCVPPWFVHGLATPADTLFDERVRGHWVNPSLDPLDSTEVGRAEFDPIHGSRLITRDENGESEWRIRLVRLGTHWFADCQVLSMDAKVDSTIRASQVDSLRSYHMIARMDVEADTLTIRVFDDEVVK
jgi:hypothetical protein